MHHDDRRGARLFQIDIYVKLVPSKYEFITVKVLSTFFFYK